MTVTIVVKNYQHINSALGHWDTPTGKLIRNKRHYYDELKRQNMIPQEKAEAIANTTSQNRRKPYKLSMDTQQLLQTVKNSADKNGKVHIEGRALEKMISMGAVAKKSDLAKLPTHYSKGGFDNKEK